MTVEERVALAQHINRIVTSANELSSSVLRYSIISQDDIDTIMSDFSKIITDVDIVRDEMKRYGIT